MRSRLLALAAILALIVTGGAAIGCGDDDEGDDGGGGGGDLGLINEGTLTVGSDIPFEPFEQGKAPDYEGFDIDVTNEVASGLDLEVDYQDTAFDTIFRDLAQGKFDLVASAATITPERDKTIDFSDPYYEAEQALVVQSGSDIATVDDLANKTVGAQDGTTGETYANDETDAKSVRGFPEAADAFTALSSGQVDAVIIDIDPSNTAVEQSDGKLEVATNIPTGELYGLAIGQDNDALREAVNEQLAEMKENGKLEEIYKEWFDKEVPDSVLDGTTEPK